MEKDKPLIRIDLSIEQRLERIERVLFNINTCDRCKQDFGGSAWSKYWNHSGMRVCWACFEIMEDNDNGRHN